MVEEIERVIFNAYSLTDRLGASSFEELLEIRLEGSRQKRERQQQKLTKASADLTNERVKKDGLKGLEKDRDEKNRSIKKDKIDRQSLITKGNEERAKRHEQVSLAADVKRHQVEQAKRRHQALIHLQSDVLDFRSRIGPSILADLMEVREDAGLSATDWEAFKLDYVGSVDSLLAERRRQAHALVLQLEGPAKTDPPVQSPDDTAVVLIPEDANLADQTLALLERELDRLRTLVGVMRRTESASPPCLTRSPRPRKRLQKFSSKSTVSKALANASRRLLKYDAPPMQPSSRPLSRKRRNWRNLYTPIKKRIEQAAGSLSKLSFSVRRHVNVERWAAAGEALLDLRTNGPFKGRGELLQSARAVLLPAWETGDAAQAATTLLDFVKANEGALRTHKPEDTDFRAWARNISDWLYSTDHISVGYGVQYDGVDIEQLSPGTRGIVLLLLYLTLDAEDDRTLIIDQPEEILTPNQSSRNLCIVFAMPRSVVKSLS